MALSDEWLLSPEGKKAVRRVLEELIAGLPARAAFLIDEDGDPFATVGSVEFSFPHPLTGLSETGALLSALVGENHDETSGYIVEKAGQRALLAVWLDPPPAKASASALRKRVRKSARELARFL